MATVQYLKKKLKSVRSTQKISKAMKTASTVKYSKINSVYCEFSVYEQACDLVYAENRAHYNALLAPKNQDAPEALIVIAGNKGMCAGFNSELLSFAEDIIKNSEKPSLVFACGNKAKAFFREKKIETEKSYVFSDVPLYSEVLELKKDIESYISNAKVSCVRIVYQRYSNMMRQTPSICDLFEAEGGGQKDSDALFVPDRESFISGTLDKILSARIYKKVLESALGAQAATLMTMRSAFDTATALADELEGEINRKRQSQVTADVLETAAEHTQ